MNKILINSSMSSFNFPDKATNFFLELCTKSEKEELDKVKDMRNISYQQCINILYGVISQKRRMNNSLINAFEKYERETNSFDLLNSELKIIEFHEDRFTFTIENEVEIFTTPSMIEWESTEDWKKEI